MPAPETIEFHFPLAGMDVSGPVGRQPARKSYQGQYCRTCVQGVNVRAFDFSNRFRGGIRPGLSKFVEARPGDTEFITQLLDVLVINTESPVQPSQSGRLVILVGVSKGNVYTLPAGDTTWNTPMNNTGDMPPLNFTGLMLSAGNIQKLFFADGTNQVYYNPETDSVETWTPTDGTFPQDADGNLPRLICTWRGRTVMANCLNDSITIFMSKVSDPFNFDYAPAVPVPADSAWSGRTGSQGLLGFPVTALIPYTDDLLIVGMEKGIAVFRGDPMAGGQLDNVTTDIGIAFGQAWCMDSTGTVYFFSSHTGVFAFIPAQGAKPQRISQAIDSLLLDIDTGQYGIRMAWWDRRKELHVFVTLLDTQQDTTHYVWESQSNSWWEDTYQDTNMNPLCCVGFDGNLQEDRVVLLGSWDGYVRALDQDAEDDDGEMILSQVMMGPFLTKFNDDVMVNDLQAVMAKDSDEVTFAIYAGKTAEEALVSTPVKSGTWTEGRNFTNLIRKSANALYVFATSTGRWAAENWRLTIDTLGKVRQRGNAAG